MLTRTFTCDSCGKDISDSSDATHRLVLSEDILWRNPASGTPPKAARTWTAFLRDEMSGLRPMDRQPRV